MEETGTLGVRVLDQPRLVAPVSTFAMLIFYLIANIAALGLPREHCKYPSWVPTVGALSCIGLISFLSPSSWIIGCIGLLVGIAWFVLHKRVGT